MNWVTMKSILNMTVEETVVLVWSMIDERVEIVVSL